MSLRVRWGLNLCSSLVQSREKQLFPGGGVRKGSREGLVDDTANDGSSNEERVTGAMPQRAPWMDESSR